MNEAARTHPAWRLGVKAPGRSPIARVRSGLGQRGLSILELLVSIQLFGILALAAVPTVSQTLQAYSLRGAAAQVFADLQNARMNAVMGNHRFRLVVIDSHTYQLHDDTNNNGVEDPGESVLTRGLDTHSSHVMLSPSAAITFAADGTAPTRATLTVSSESGDTQSLSIEVSAAGRTRILQGTRVSGPTA